MSPVNSTSLVKPKEGEQYRFYSYFTEKDRFYKYTNNEEREYPTRSLGNEYRVNYSVYWRYYNNMGRFMWYETTGSIDSIGPGFCL